MSNPLPEELLELIVRFTAAIPDLPLTIESPRTTTTLALKLLIRPHLPPDLKNNRLRLIYSGKVLEETVPLSRSLNLRKPSPPPPPPKASKAKGKQPIRDDFKKRDPPPVSSKIYIH